MKSHFFLALCLSSFGPLGASAFAATPPPNIVFFLADDIGIFSPPTPRPTP